MKCIDGLDIGELITIETNWLNIGDIYKCGENTFKVVYIATIA